MSTSLASSAFLATLAFGSGMVCLAQEPNPGPVATPPVSTAAPASPGIRIVRLSEINGKVSMDRGNKGFEPAFVNLPVVQGSQLRTDEGIAEVEFEDGSSLRLTTDTTVEFPVLTSRSDGSRTTVVHVSRGAVYASLVKGHPSDFTVTFGHDDSLRLGPAAHLELSVSPAAPRLYVLDGTVEAVNGATTELVTHKKGLVFSPADGSLQAQNKRPEETPFDAWDKRSVEYHNASFQTASFGGTPYQYGLADLNYYGSFLGGSCGGMWRPYFVSSSWSPYANGTWAYYPGGGYSFVSPYPWGWAPFHYGSWAMCPGAGWAWSPSGGDWYGLQNTVYPAASTGKLPKGVTRMQPPRPPVHAATLVSVNEQPLVRSGLNEQNGSFVFRRDSAGLGVPRSLFGNLRGVSGTTVSHGTYTQPIAISMPQGMGQSRTMAPGFGAANVHAGNTGRGGMAPASSATVGSAGMGAPMGGAMAGTMSGAMGAGSHSTGGSHH